MNIASVVCVLFDEVKDLVHLEDFAFHAGNLADANHLALAVG